MKKVYFYASVGQKLDSLRSYDVCGPFESVGQMLDSLRDEGGDPRDREFSYFEAVQGEYIPPSTPETVRFPS